MGCDIHIHTEVRDPKTGKWEWDGLTPFEHRSYGVFGFFTHTVRNYSAVPPVFTDKPRGIPSDSPTSIHHQEYVRPGALPLWPPYDEVCSYECPQCNGDYHSASYLTLRELAEFDYDQLFEDRRVTVNGDGGCTSAPNGGEMTTYREFLGETFMNELEELKTLGGLDDVRIVFWFDN